MFFTLHGNKDDFRASEGASSSSSGSEILTPGPISKNKEQNLFSKQNPFKIGIFQMISIIHKKVITENATINSICYQLYYIRRLSILGI